MKASTIILIIIMIFLIVMILKDKKEGIVRKEEKEIWPLYKRRIMSSPEQVLYFRLTEALPGKLVFCQVQLSRIIGVKKGYNYIKWTNRINRMSADFVICEKSADVIAVIELDDSTHDREGRQRADQKKDVALMAAGIRIIRVRANRIPTTNEIAALFR